MTEFVVDKGLDVLLAQINTAAPNRSKASDGSIGDAAHAARDSDHNPESPPPPGNPDHQVDARDFTHDPVHNADMGIVSEAIRASRDRRVSYVIFNRRIFSSYTSTGGRPAWTWGAYSGEDPHTGHMHISVNDVHHDETQLWQIGITMADLAPHEVVNALANGSRDTGYITGPPGEFAAKYNLRLISEALAKLPPVLAEISAQVKANGAALSEIKALLGADPDVDLDQIVRDAVRVELDATRLSAG